MDENTIPQTTPENSAAEQTATPQSNYRPRHSGLYPMQQNFGGYNNNTRGGRFNKNDRNNNQQQQQRRVEFKKKPNPFGDKGLKTIDYLDAKALTKFTNSQGKILPKRINGTTAYQQRQISKAIKYARHLALLPFVANDLS